MPPRLNSPARMQKRERRADRLGNEAFEWPNLFYPNTIRRARTPNVGATLRARAHDESAPFSFAKNQIRTIQDEPNRQGWL
jgi:hypothetical protein